MVQAAQLPPNGDRWPADMLELTDTVDAGPSTNTGGNIYGQVAIPVLGILAILLKLAVYVLADILNDLAGC